MKKILIIATLFIIAFFSGNIAAFAETFYIDNYKVKVEVTEENVAHVREELDVFFTSQSHGILRTIPTRYNISRSVGFGYEAKTRLSKIKVNAPFKIYTERKYTDIKIGDKNAFVKGPQKYIITYDMYLGKDKLYNEDEFYFNLVGTEWSVNIEQAEFEVVMPKEFAPEKVGISIGKYGKAGFDGDAQFTVEGKTIKGVTKRTLYPNEGITIRISLPEKYFKVDLFDWLTPGVVVMLLLTLIVFVTWFVYGKDDKVIPVVSFYPPANLNSAEVGLAYSGIVTTKEIVSLLFYLAGKGYLELLAPSSPNGDDSLKDIKNEETEGAKSAQSYTIKKLKEYNGGNYAEKKLMEALFAKGDSVTVKELEKSPTFYQECETCETIVQKSKSKFFVSAIGWTNVLIGLCIVVIVSVMAGFDIFSIGPMLFALPFLGFGLMMIGGAFDERTPSAYRGGAFVLGCVISAIPVVVVWDSLAFIGTDTGIIGLVCVLFSLGCLVNMSKRSKYGTKVMGEILGFKRFLEVAEKSRIKALIQENPSYCYDMLPYAYVLDVEDTWIKNFESIVSEPPQWYKGDSFNMSSFKHISGSMNHASSPSYENGGLSHSSSSSHSSGGGGHSGGGHGGGGGRSW